MIRQRCAIYTRKSSEEGLDMEFNSLDAQRDACEAYVASQRADIEIPATAVLKSRQAGVLGEYFMGALVPELFPVTQPRAHLRDYPPVRPGLTRWRNEPALAGDTALGVGHRAVLLAPARGGQ